MSSCKRYPFNSFGISSIFAADLIACVDMAVKEMAAATLVL